MVWGCCGMYIEVLGFRFRLLGLAAGVFTYWAILSHLFGFLRQGLVLWPWLGLNSWVTLLALLSQYCDYMHGSYFPSLILLMNRQKVFFFFWLGMFWCNTMRRTIAIKKIKMIWHFCFETGTFINSVCVLELEIRTLYIQGITV